jgi:hypothetical protein
MFLNFIFEIPTRSISEKKPITKKGWWSGQGIGPEFKSQYRKKKEK